MKCKCGAEFSNWATMLAHISLMNSVDGGGHEQKLPKVVKAMTGNVKTVDN